MTVIGKGEGVDDGVVPNHGDGEEDCGKDVDWPEDLGVENEVCHLQGR